MSPSAHDPSAPARRVSRPESEPVIFPTSDPLRAVRLAGLAWLCIGLGPTAHTWQRLGGDRAGNVLMITLIAAALASGLRGATKIGRIVGLLTGMMAGSAGVAMIASAGSGIWVAFAILPTTFGVVLMPRREPPFGISPAAGPAVGLSLLATRIGWTASTAAVAIVITAIAGFLALGIWIGPARARRFEARLAVVGRRVGQLATWVFFVVLWVPTVLLPWVFHTLIRWDPLWTPRRRGSTWLDISTRRSGGGRSWSSEADSQLDTRWRRAHRRVGRIVVAVAVLAGGLSVVRAAVLAGPEVFDAPAMADSPFWRDLSHAQEVLAWRTEMRGYDVSALPVSLRSEHLNIEDRRRVSWAPPDRTCPATEIWMFGGSTTFGYAQRDGYTIASQLARMAWAEGRAVRVLNWGVPGDTHWIEARRLEAALLDGPTRPALVVFYDGVNEYGAQAGLSTLQRTGDPLFATFEDSGLFPNIKRIWAPINALFIRDGDVSVPAAPDRESGPEAVVAATARQYSLSVVVSRRVLEQHGIYGLHFYQPWRATRDRAVAAEVGGDPLIDGFDRAQTDRLRSLLPDGVIDLGDVMNTTRQPVYYDGIHTNELGARVVARAMLDHIRPRLGPPCDRP